MRERDNTVLQYLKVSLMFAPVLLYPPLLFGYAVKDNLRIVSFFLLTIFLIFRNSRFDKQSIKIVLLILALCLSLIYTNYLNLSGLRTAGNLILTILFAWGLKRYLCFNFVSGEILVKIYIFLFFVIAASSLFSYFYLIIFGDHNILNIYSPNYNYLFTPTGVLLTKSFGSVFIYRSFFYFIEPVYLAIFYAANIFLVAIFLNKNLKNVFIFANLIGGVLTVSYAFFLLVPIIWFVKCFKLTVKNLFAVLCLASFIIALIMFQSFEYSSIDDRLGRAASFFVSVEQSSFSNLFFGHGFGADTGFDKHFSVGILSGIYEIGLFNFVILLLIAFLLVDKFVFFVIFLISLLLFESHKYPFFWVLLVLSSHVGNRVNYRKSRTP